MTTLRNVEILGAPGIHDIVVEGGRIRSIDPESSSGGATIVFDQAIAFPGLINSHDHLEFDAYDQLDGGPYRDYIEWADKVRIRHEATFTAVEAVPRELRVRLGIAKNLISGVTSVAHHGQDPQCLCAPIGVIEGTRSIHSPRLEGIRGMLVPDRRPLVAHVGEGVGEEAEREIDTFLKRNILRKKLIGVHAIAMRFDQAEQFEAIVWCPVSNEFLYGRTAPIAALKRHSTILFGTDSTLTAPWNIWQHLRRARELAQLTDDELIAALTTNAARIWHLPDHGHLNVGGFADIVVAHKVRKDQREAFFATDPENILLVMRHGEVALVDSSLRSQIPSSAARFSVTVNGIGKLTSVDFSDLDGLASYLKGVQ